MSTDHHTIQSTAQPPAQPAYVLRGHSAQIHAVHFYRENLRLLTGDADGWVVLWNLPIRRPTAVWRAHSATILGVASWEDDRIITHGRDGKLQVWQLKVEDESTFSTTLPIDDAISERKAPWLLHSILVNTLNFCSFAICLNAAPTTNNSDSILIATPGVQDGHINVISLPAENRVATIPSPKDVNTGMVMAIGLTFVKDKLTVLAGYESGHVATWQQIGPSKFWQTVYVNKAHSQPILSLGISAELGCFFTSSADAIIARHPLPGSDIEAKTVQTKHAGQQSLAVRSDDKIFATAGWDGRARVYSAKSMSELAVLKWHKEGCYAVAFADLAETSAKDEEGLTNTKLTVSEQRTAKAKSTHWLTVGSKDGKVSLWEIY